MNKKIKLYLSGPMTFVPLNNVPLFNLITAKLRKKGYKVINPAELDNKNRKKVTWEDLLRRDISYLVTCDGVATLPGWTRSRGASLEVYIAQALSMDVRGADKFLKGKKVKKK